MVKEQEKKKLIKDQERLVKDIISPLVELVRVISNSGFSFNDENVSRYILDIAIGLEAVISDVDELVKVSPKWN